MEEEGEVSGDGELLVYQEKRRRKGMEGPGGWELLVNEEEQ